MTSTTQPIFLTGGGLSIHFEFDEDRFHHSIGLGEAANSQLLTSAEGTSDDIWPASPPLQEILMAEQNGLQIAMLIGIAGKSHWSVAVEFDPVAGRALFDVACRATLQPERLGSLYHLAEGVELTQNAGSILAQLPGGVLCIEPQAIDGISAELSQASGNLGLIANSAEASVPQTIRWKYAVTRLENDG